VRERTLICTDDGWWAPGLRKKKKHDPFSPRPFPLFFSGCRERISEPLTAICMQSSGTRLGITFLIVINGIMIGMETDQRLQGEGWEVSF
jgi:hypothetical protein